MSFTHPQQQVGVPAASIASSSIPYPIAAIGSFGVRSNNALQNNHWQPATRFEDDRQNVRRFNEQNQQQLEQQQQRQPEWDDDNDRNGSSKNARLQDEQQNQQQHQQYPQTSQFRVRTIENPVTVPGGGRRLEFAQNSSAHKRSASRSNSKNQRSASYSPLESMNSQIIDPFQLSAEPDQYLEHLVISESDNKRNQQYMNSAGNRNHLIGSGSNNTYNNDNLLQHTAYQSKDQSYIYSRESTPEDISRGDTTATYQNNNTTGIISYNNYQLKQNSRVISNNSNSQISQNQQVSAHFIAPVDEDTVKGFSEQSSASKLQQYTHNQQPTLICQQCGPLLVAKTQEFNELQAEYQRLEEMNRNLEIEILKLASTRGIGNGQSSSRSQQQQQQSGNGSPSVQNHQKNVISELYEQIENLNEIIDDLKRDNSQMTGDINAIKSKHAQQLEELKFKYSTDIEGLILQNRKLQMNARGNGGEVQELTNQIHGLLAEKSQLSALNAAQLEDIKVLMRDKDILHQRVNEIAKKSDMKVQELARAQEQMKIEMNKEFDSRLNQKLQEMHYKYHMQLQKQKKSLSQQQGQSGEQTMRGEQTRRGEQTSRGEYTARVSTSVDRVNSHHHNQNNNSTIEVKRITAGNKQQRESQHLQSTQSLVNVRRASPSSRMYVGGKAVADEMPTGRRSTSRNRIKTSGGEDVQVIRSMNNVVDFTEKHLIWEICGILRSENIKSLPGVIAKMKDQNRQLQRFVDSVVELVVSCHPQGFFSSGEVNGSSSNHINNNQNGSPTLKQCWKWLKSIMEEYVSLKTMLPTDDFEEQVCTLLNVQNKFVAQQVLADKIVECTIANRIFAKIAIILKLQKCGTYSEYEAAINALYRDFVDHSDQTYAEEEGDDDDDNGDDGNGNGGSVFA